MPLLAANIATTGFALAKKFGLRKKAGQALSKGFGLLRDKFKDAKFSATEKGFTLSADGFQAKGGSAAPGAAAQTMESMKMNYLPYVVGGALLLILLKK